MLTRHPLMTLRATGQRVADAIAIQIASVCATRVRNLQLRERVRIARSMADMPNVAQMQIRAATGEILADAQRTRGAGS